MSFQSSGSVLVGKSEETLLGHYFDDTEENRPIRKIKRAYWSYMTHGILLVLCIFFFVAWLHARSQYVNMPYSPANVAIEYQKDLTTFNGSFDFPSIYRGNPSPELDDAWFRISKGGKATLNLLENLSNFQTMRAVSLTRLTREELLKMGKVDTPSKVRFSEADGGGYMAVLEVSHQLHCLNVLRKYVHFDHYGTVDPFFTESKPETYRRHLEHCIDNLRQALMCTADSGMITFEWVRGFSTPYPDFNTRHRCRNFEKMIGWQNANGVDNVIPQSHVIRLDGEVDLISVP